MIIGFTGSRHGMSHTQSASVRRLLELFNVTVLHHGAAQGADEQAHNIAHELHAYTVQHPSTHKLRGVCPMHSGDSRRLPVAALLRNRYIVTASQRLIAAPFTRHPIIRSGTWATVRYAMRVHSRAWIVTRNGDVFYLTKRDDSTNLWIWDQKNLDTCKTLDSHDTITDARQS